MWGIRPFYDVSKFLINARDDSLLKLTWKKSLEERRCIILADGFYEWQKLKGAKNKVPYRFQMKNGQPFAFAGVWQIQKDEQDNKIPHCAIITTSPNKVVKKVHDRMPAILLQEDEQEWLNPDLETEQVLKLIKPYPDTEMTFFPISTMVNNYIYDTEEIIKPAENSK
jgi:putative SOS response-associated peptidase YedK